MKNGKTKNSHSRAPEPSPLNMHNVVEMLLHLKRRNVKSFFELSLGLWLFPKILNNSKGDQLLAHSWRMKNALRIFPRIAICSKQADCMVVMHVRMGVGPYHMISYDIISCAVGISDTEHCTHVICLILQEIAEHRPRSLIH